jgi:hypothetical protein
MKELQPGQPTFSEWEFENMDTNQSFVFTLTIIGKEGTVRNPWIELDGYYKIEIQGEFKAGSSLVCDGSQMKLYNEKGSFEHDVTIASDIPKLISGRHKIKFDCIFSAENEVKNRFIVKTISRPEVILN